MPWSGLGNVARLACPDDLTAFVEQRGWESLHADQASIDEWFVHDYVRNSWEGLVLDPPRVPAVLEPDNIRKVGGALAEAAASLGHRRRRRRPPARGRPEVPADEAVAGPGWVVLGAGGHARSVVDVLERAGHTVVAVSGQTGGQPWHVDVLADDAAALVAHRAGRPARLRGRRRQRRPGPTRRRPRGPRCQRPARRRQHRHRLAPQPTRRRHGRARARPRRSRAPSSVTP